MRIRSSAAWCVLACGCDAVFGLSPTHSIDAAYFDAHIDAPFTCPPPSSPPHFSSSFTQAVLQSCTKYTASTTAGTALATCLEGTSSFIEEGTLDRTMTPALGLQDPRYIYSQPRLAPDGNDAMIYVYDTQMFSSSFAELARDTNGWTKVRDVSPGFAIASSTEPTRGSPRHLLAMTPTGELHELTDAGGVWTDLTTHTFGELGVDRLGFELSWTPDGLRLVFDGELVGASTDQLLYAWRSSLGEAFSTAVPMPGIDFAPPGFLTEDCGRFYFSSFGSVFFAPRD